MATTKRKINFFESEEGAEVKRVLGLMASDSSYNTASRYSANSDLYPDNVMTFVDKHMHYLSAHPSTNPQQYISNLRLMTRVK
jgi:hypothetical protein